jgi:hypothetical protein
VPRHQFIDAFLWPTIHEACQQIGEIGPDPTVILVANSTADAFTWNQALNAAGGPRQRDVHPSYRRRSGHRVATRRGLNGLTVSFAGSIPLESREINGALVGGAIPVVAGVTLIRNETT